MIAFCKPDQVVDVSEKIVSIQRDFGDRSNRAHARLMSGRSWKDSILEELEKRLGFILEAPKAYKFESNGDRYGWVQDYEGFWNVGLYIEGGRVSDNGKLKIKTGLKKLLKFMAGIFV